MNNHPEILFIDDSQTSRRLARKILQEKYRVITCSDGQEGWDLLKSNPSIQVVFSDIQMANMNGMQLLKQIRESDEQRIAAVPVIMITGTSDDEALMRAVFEMGATDFIFKPFKTMDLLSRSYSYIKLNRRISDLEDNVGHDELTQLYNITGIKTHASRLLAFAKRHRMSFSLVYLEILEFQQLATRHGKGIAAQILVNIAKRFKSSLRTEDIVGRVGTSRFAILLPACNLIKARSSAHRIQLELQNIIFECNGQKLGVRIAAGVTTAEDGEYRSVDDMILEADSALQTAMSQTTSGFACYQQSPEQAGDDDVSAVHNFTESLIHIIDGNFHKVDEQHADALVDKLVEFIHYRNGRQKRKING